MEAFKKPQQGIIRQRICKKCYSVCFVLSIYCWAWGLALRVVPSEAWL